MNRLTSLKGRKMIIFVMNPNNKSLYKVLSLNDVKNIESLYATTIYGNIYAVAKNYENIDFPEKKATKELLVNLSILNSLYKSSKTNPLLENQKEKTL